MSSWLKYAVHFCENVNSLGVVAPTLIHRANEDHQIVPQFLPSKLPRASHLTQPYKSRHNRCPKSNIWNFGIFHNIEAFHFEKSTNVVNILSRNE